MNAQDLRSRLALDNKQVHLDLECRLDLDKADPAEVEHDIELVMN